MFKKFSLSLVLVLVLILVIPIFFDNGFSSNVYASSIKISDTKYTLSPGGTYKLSISGTSKKVKWSSSDKSIAKVSSSGKVTAKSVGKAYIYATVKSKTLKCKITVKVATIKESNITYTLKDTGFGVVAILKNNNTLPVDIEPQMIFLDSDGDMLGTSSDSNYCLESGGTCALYFDPPQDTNYNNVGYSSYYLNLNMSKSYISKFASSKISIISNTGSSGVVVGATNHSSYTLEFVKLSIVYYDSNSNCIGYSSKYFDCNNIGESSYYTFNYPYDQTTYLSIIPSDYKIYVNYAYAY